jgi:hypothetical protein
MTTPGRTLSSAAFYWLMPKLPRRTPRQYPSGYLRKFRQVRPVYQLWRDGQTLQLQLAERSRYSKLQQSSDANWIRCASSSNLRTQLDTTTRKLENLTDIERQLVA